MKAKIFFYSLEGNTKTLAEAMAKALNCEISELVPVKEYPKTGFKKFLSGKDVLFKEKPTLENYDNSTDCDLIIIGTPIWAGSFAPPIRTFLGENDLSGKKIVVFACHAGGGASKCFEETRSILKNSEVVATKDFVVRLKNNSDEYIEMAVNWAVELAK